MPRPSEFMQTNPVRLDISRSKFHMSPRWTGTFNSFKLVPIFTYPDILPGDTFKLDVAMALRMSTPAVPVMDDLYLDVAFYFVPYKLVLSRSYMSPSVNDANHSWAAFIGAQDSLLNMPLPANGITIPKMLCDSSDGFLVGGIADCMGLPALDADNGNSYEVSSLPFLSFMAVWNENYRDPNAQDPGVFSISSGSVDVTWLASSRVTGSSILLYDLPNVCRFHGYFGSALPWPQRNSEGIGISLAGTAPVVGVETMHAMGAGFKLGYENIPSASYANDHLFLNRPGFGKVGDLVGYNWYADGDDTNPPSGATKHSVTQSNLVANLSNVSVITVNAFRAAVQEQRWYEALARSGNNGLDVMTAGMFGVVPKDAGQSRVEYLGGKRIPISVTQVNSTAETSAGDLGKTGAFSLTNDSDYYFTKSFDTWGCLIGVCCVRYRDSFAQGLDRFWRRFDRFQYYWPQFANLGEQAVMKSELFGDLDLDENTENTNGYDSVFGYQEAWAEYRTINDHVTGLARPGKSLGHWTYANDFDDSINIATFIRGYNAAANVDRTLLVSSSTSGFQFFGQFQFDIIAVRPLPTYSIPGLVDHH